LASLHARIPSREEITPVFSTILFLVFSWALYHMFWQVPSWLYYMNVWGVLALSAYVLAYSLLESAAILGLVLLVCLLFPQRYFREQFVAQSCALAGILGLGAVAIQRKIGLVFDLQIWQLITYPLLGLAMLPVLTWLLAIVLRRMPRLARLLNSLAERMTVFALIYIPLGILGLIVVIIRNIL